MMLERTAPLGTESALFANKRFLVLVHRIMVPQLGNHLEPFATNFTRICLIVTVKPLVVVQGIPILELLATHRTLNARHENPVAMPFQGLRSLKRFETHRTFVGL